MTTSAQNNNSSPLETPFLGLAPFLRKSIAGTDLLPVAQELLGRAEDRPDDANLWMNLSIAIFCVGQRDFGLAIQAQALALKRIYHLPAAEQPARLRLLMLMAPGDLAENTPLDCLLENSDIDLDFYYITPESPLALPIPEHDALIVAISESDENRCALLQLEEALADWPKPVINAPKCIPTTERSVASRLLQNVPGLLMPTTRRVPRLAMQAIARGDIRLSEQFNDHDFPVILRPVGSQAGRDLAKIDDPAGIAQYLSGVDAAEFFLSRFIDYSGKDGLFRKYRVALIKGAAFACHMAVSSNWMIHYVNAGMYEDAEKRAQEACFMSNFEDFSWRHRAALDAICQRTGLDYLCIDCAETREGQLLVFEADHVMVVHAMDSEDLFPYKQFHMQKVQRAFRDFLLHLTSASISEPLPG